MRFFKVLRVRDAHQLIGKTIKWAAPSYEGNKPYGGTAIITGVADGKYRSPLHTDCLSGDKLDVAFVEDGYSADALHFSDFGRFVTYEVLDEKDQSIKIKNGKKGWVLQVGDCCIAHGFNGKVYAVEYEDGIPYGSTEWVSIQALRAFWHKFMPIILHEAKHNPHISVNGILEPAPGFCFSRLPNN